MGEACRESAEGTLPEAFFKSSAHTAGAANNIYTSKKNDKRCISINLYAKLWIFPYSIVKGKDI